jgi:hypothetical protein
MFMPRIWRTCASPTCWHGLCGWVGLGRSTPSRLDLQALLTTRPATGQANARVQTWSAPTIGARRPWEQHAPAAATVVTARIARCVPAGGAGCSLGRVVQKRCFPVQRRSSSSQASLAPTLLPMCVHQPADHWERERIQVGSTSFQVHWPGWLSDQHSCRVSSASTWQLCGRLSALSAFARRISLQLPAQSIHPGCNWHHH